MRVACKQCGSVIPSGDVNIDTVLARCRNCNEVFSFADQVGATPEAGAAAQMSRPSTDSPLPPRMTVESGGVGLVITRKWFTPAAFALLAFCIFWDGFLVFWYYMAFTQNGPLVMKLFPLLHAAAGIFLTWLMVAMFVNRTTISINYDAVEVRHSPVPWPGNKRVPAEQIAQLYCSDVIRRSRNGASTTFEVRVKTTDDRMIKLVSGLDSQEQALYIEQKIERFLDIKDQHVPGELKA